MKSPKVRDFESENLSVARDYFIFTLYEPTGIRSSFLYVPGLSTSVSPVRACSEILFVFPGTSQIPNLTGSEDDPYSGCHR